MSSQLSIDGQEGIARFLSRNNWTTLRGMGIHTRAEAPATLLNQGSAGGEVLVLLSGATKVTRLETNGARVLVAIRGGGDLIGDLAAIDGDVRSATVTAVTSVTFRRIAQHEFIAFIDRPGAALSYAKYCAGRQRDSDQRLTEIAGLTARTRLARALVRLVGRASQLDPLVGLGQQDLANLIGTSRNTMSAELQYLRAAGIVTTGWRRLEVIDLEGLIELADLGAPDQ